jgi:hypothetical protein
MTEFSGTHDGQIGYEVTGLTVAAEEVIAARPELVWDMSTTLRAMKASAESYDQRRPFRDASTSARSG